MKTRTFQQIYDFCKLNATYRMYHDAPDEFACKTKREYRRYYGIVNHERGISRLGNFIYGQAIAELRRFLQLKSYREDLNIRFHIHVDTHEIINPHDFDSFSDTIYITSGIVGTGVRINFTHPFNHHINVYFNARSHNTYTKEGLRNEVVKHIDKHLLFAPGRYRDLQVQNKVVKEDFRHWYEDYKWRQEKMAEQEYWDMIEIYQPTPERLSFDDAYGLLNGAGLFFDFGCDEYEKEQLAGEFMDMCNR